MADAVEWVARHRGLEHLFHYLDDFLLIWGFPWRLRSWRARAILLLFEVDTATLELRLPERKILELKGLIGEWYKRKSCRKRELPSLAGKLQHACKVVKPGRSFLRRVFELLAGVSLDCHHVRLNASFHSDLRWREAFLEEWNGTSILVRLPVEGLRMVDLYSDASGGFGCGAWWGHRWLRFAWPDQWGGRNNTLKEIVPVVLAGSVWGPLWFGVRVVAHVDNEAAVAVLNSGYSKEGGIMHLIRILFFIVAFYQISLSACHIPGTQNGIADAISRDNLPVFFSLLQVADRWPAPIPQALVALLVTE